jgi:hypothetical protein
MQRFKLPISRCKMAGAGFHSIAKLRAQIFNPVLADPVVYSADCHNGNSHTADCQSQESRFESGLPQTWTLRIVHIRPQSGSWQSAVHWKAVCQGGIIVVATHGIRAQELAIEWNPAPAILHREALSLNCHIFLKSDFTSLKLIRGALFRPKIYVNGLNWHTISWYYTSKKPQYFRILNLIALNVQKPGQHGSTLEEWY